jgi:FkbM family methyltransferase
LFFIFFIYNKGSFKDKNSYSQLGQDIEVLKILNNKKNGYFVDIGATDGITGSNSYLLEKKFNWKGICIEPREDEFNKLQKNRKSLNYNVLLYSNEQILEFTHGDQLSGITKDLDTYSDQLKNNKKSNYMSTTLTKILDNANAPNIIDYISIDTEGSELEILKGLDLNKYKFKIINFEHNNETDKREKIKKLLEKYGYKFYKNIHVDDFYILNL